MTTLTISNLCKSFGDVDVLQSDDLVHTWIIWTSVPEKIAAHIPYRLALCAAMEALLDYCRLEGEVVEVEADAGRGTLRLVLDVPL